MKNKEQFFNSIIYNTIIGILALVAVAIAIYDLAKGINSYALYLLDNSIWIIFIADYIIRLILSDNKIKFFKNNILDLISIIPFNSAFRAFRLVKTTRLIKITRLSKLTKLVRLTAFTLRCLKKCKKFLNTNGFKYILIVALIIVILGTLGIHFAEGMTYKDAIWWSFVTTTTVGYGDISPSTDIGRIIACILMLVGIGLIGSLTSTITSFFFNSNEKQTDFKSSEIENIKKSIDNLEKLTDDDIDNICRILKALKNK